MSRGVNVLALLKGGERYIFLFDDQSHEQLLTTLGSYACDPELSFTWYDAAVLSQRAQGVKPVDAGPAESHEVVARRAPHA